MIGVEACPEGKLLSNFEFERSDVVKVQISATSKELGTEERVVIVGVPRVGASNVADRSPVVTRCYIGKVDNPTG